MLNHGRDSDTEERKSFVEFLPEAELSQVAWNRNHTNRKKGDAEADGKVNHQPNVG